MLNGVLKSHKKLYLLISTDATAVNKKLAALSYNFP